MAAQDNTVTQNLPELQEWYSVKGAVRGLVSYLPGFDSVGGGMNAITINMGNSDRVFYNRFPFDTTAQFQWKPDGGEIVVQIDFNNDGIHDYVDYRGRLYTGSKKGEKPNPEPIRTLTTRIADRNFIHDFNNDSYPDVMVRNGAARVEILFGNKELSQMKSSTKPYPRSASFIGGYSNEYGKPRMILYSHEDYTEGFYLYGIRTANKGDSTEIFLDELDKIEIQKIRKDEPRKFESTQTLLYKNVPSEGTLFKFVYANPQQGSPASNAYLIIQDKFIDQKKSIPGTITLEGSFDGDTIPDIGTLELIIKDNIKKWYIQLYSGNTLINQVPVSQFEVPRGLLGFFRVHWRYQW